MIKYIIAVLLSVLSLTSAAEPDSIYIKVTGTGFKNDIGRCRLLVFDSEKGFPEISENAVLAFSGIIIEGETIFEFKTLPGTYAVTLMHDQNGNRKLDKNWIGAPKEGFGFSRNAKVIMGAPDFKEAAFIVKENTSLEIKMIYLQK